MMMKLVMFVFRFWLSVCLLSVVEICEREMSVSFSGRVLIFSVFVRFWVFWIVKLFEICVPLVLLMLLEFSC